MKNISIVLFLMLSFFLSETIVSQSVNFYEGSWEEAQEEAANVNKYILVDAYTDWCSWCKVMDKKTFSDSLTGSFINANFVSFKMNMEEGIGIKLAIKYRITGYPSYMFFNSKGILVYKSSGFQPPEKFLVTVKDAMDEKKQFKYPGDPKMIDLELPEFYYNAYKKGKDRKWPSRETVSEFLETQEDLFSEKNWTIMFRLNTNDKYTKFFLENQKKYAELYGWNEVNSKIDKILYKKIQAAIKNKDKEKLDEALVFIDKYKTENPENIKFIYKNHYYEKIEDFGTLINSINEMIVFSGFENHSKINSYCWNIYENVDDKSIVEGAAEIMKSMIKKHTEYAYVDTYAALLFKSGNFKDATKYALKAIEIGKANGEKVESTEELLKKIAESRK
ncbi:MAG: DUF255 domain-containing protein [Bacteroidetes bacterium]|nr:DUF255 domain-containing protein [Bacteroidota bacterium]MBT6687301.1 DUF255 domain-containing protein [Bacteroidota bacterium]MBT7143965.1 DUF255 domain-containing protein [Bacteroidota bacterium]MBT7491122.1 DUF255 domain-containing protein [Bacteroidota bacterium]